MQIYFSVKIDYLVIEISCTTKNKKKKMLVRKKKYILFFRKTAGHIDLYGKPLML